MKFSESYERSAVWHDRMMILFGMASIVDGALVFSDKLLLAIFHGISGLVFGFLAYGSWELSKIDRKLAASHRKDERL